MNKLLLGIVIGLCLMMNMGSNSMAMDMKLDIRVNDVRLKLDSEPYIQSERTMIPVRAVAEVLGATEVIWNSETKSATIMYKEKEIVLTIDSYKYMINEIEYDLEVAPIIKDGRMMIPMRVIAEELDCEVAWNDQLYTVEIQKADITVTEALIAVNQYSYEDVLWLARIVHVEGYNIGYEANLAIANVVLNRVSSSSFPNSVYDVIFEDAYAVQFPPAHKEGFEALEPSKKSWAAAKNALSGNNNIAECVYFNDRPFKSKADDLYSIIEGEYFYY